MNQIRKIKNNPEISDIYYFYGDTDNFDKFRGSERWQLMKKIEYFSNDRSFEMDGELKNGAYISRYNGIGKAIYSNFNEDGIGVKK